MDLSDLQIKRIREEQLAEEERLKNEEQEAEDKV